MVGNVSPLEEGWRQCLAAVQSMALLAGVCAALFACAAYGAAPEPSKVAGPNACAECHKQEVEAWKSTHHFSTFRQMPRNSEAKAIADRLGIKRIKAESLCLNCHFTVQQKDSRIEPVAGISCESCHSAAQDWIKVHSGYSGKTATTESKAEEDRRWQLAEEKGMIRPKTLYRLAKNCLGCHLVPHEQLVNVGGHKAGSAFELLSWSQGEVRHNTWTSKGKDNVAADAARRRMLYLIGLGVEMEAALRGVAKATVRKPYAFLMAQRVDKARKQLAGAAKAVPGIPEIAKLVEHGHVAGLKLNNQRSLISAADEVAKILEDIAAKYDGSSMAGLDGIIPGPETYKGKARKASAVN